MLRLNLVTLRPALLKAVVDVGIAALTVLATRVFGPQQTAAQSAQAGDIRATSFTLVGPDGTVLAKLAPSPSGSGNLTLFDTAGRPRTSVAGAGTVLFDTDGKPRMVLSYNDAGGNGGVFAMDANGKPRMFAGYHAAVGRSYVAVYDGNSPPSSACGPLSPRAILANDSDGFAGVLACDTDGNRVYTAP